MHQLREPIVSVSQPLSEVRDSLRQLNQLLVAAITVTCVSVVVLIISVIVGCILLYRFRHTLLEFVGRKSK